MQQGMLELLRQQEEHIAAAALRVRQQEAALGAREEVLLLAEAAISMKQADLAAREEQLAKEREALEQASHAVLQKGRCWCTAGLGVFGVLFGEQRNLGWHLPGTGLLVGPARCWQWAELARQASLR